MMAFLSRPLFPRSFIPYVIDSNMLKTGPLIILSIAAVTLGYLTQELFLSYGSTFYLNSIFTHHLAHTFLFDASFGGSLVSLIPLSFLLVFFLILIISPFSSSSSSSSSSPSHIFIPSTLSKPLIPSTSFSTLPFNFTTHFTLLNYFNVFYHWVMFYTLVLSNFMFRYIDKGFLEFFGPLGLLRTLHFFGFYIELFSTGFIPHYAYVSIISLALLLISGI
jgi:hypothetical protein